MKRLATIVAVLVSLLLFALPAAAHPLGNFTINQYVGLHVEPDSTTIDLVVDRAEIAANQLLVEADVRDRKAPTTDELASIAADECERLTGGITLLVDGARRSLALQSSLAQAPPGAGGLLTLRVECELRAQVTIQAHGSKVTIENANFADRLGWAEIVVTAADVELDTALPVSSVTDRLTVYPDDLLSSPPDVREAAFTASPVDGSSRGPGESNASSETGAPTDRLAGLLGESEGGVAMIASMGVAFLLGAGHAMAPGHGKTVMAASLVGTRGRPRDALILGLSVAMSHTIGVFVLGAVTFAASAVFAPEAVFPYLAGLSGLIVTAIGAWIVLTWVRSRRRSPDHDHDHDHDHDRDHHGDHEPHSHGLVTHTHAGVGDREVTWKLLATLGLGGGLVPSVSAILLLLSAINLGRVGFGLVLIALFGVGMAATLVGVGIGVVVVGEKGLARFSGPLRSVLTRYAAPVAGTVVLLVGIGLTARAVLDVAG